LVPEVIAFHRDDAAALHQRLAEHRLVMQQLGPGAEGGTAEIGQPARGQIPQHLGTLQAVIHLAQDQQALARRQIPGRLPALGHIGQWSPELGESTAHASASPPGRVDRSYGTAPAGMGFPFYRVGEWRLVYALRRAGASRRANVTKPQWELR